MTSNGKETSCIRFVRRFIVFLIIFFILSLGVPLWKLTTTIYRAELPTDEIDELSNTLKEQIQFKIPIYLDIPNSLDHFIGSSQELINKRLYGANPRLANFWSIELRRAINNLSKEEDYIIKFKYLPADEGKDKPVESFYISPFNKETILYLTDNVVNLGKVDDFLSVVLLDHIFEEEIEEMVKLVNEEYKDAEKSMVVPYSPNYNIVFSLFIENGKSVDWEIDSSLELLKPVIKCLSHFANFSISTQIQYYSKLANQPKFDESINSYVINEFDLSTFINYGDWNLITHDINPTINFLVYFPESNYQNKPLLVENSKTNSFLIPQWGGVYVVNKGLPIVSDTKISVTESELLPIMEVFTSQLFHLLGLPNNPKSPSIRIDILSRVSIFKNLRQSLDNLNSLVKLTRALNEISIPEVTKKYVLETISLVKDSMAELNSNQNYDLSMQLSSKALKNSDKAFFEKEIVQQAYFPDEHKLAVFLPLLGPVCSIVSLGLIKLIKDVKLEKKEKQD